MPAPGLRGGAAAVERCVPAPGLRGGDDTSEWEALADALLMDLEGGWLEVMKLPSRLGGYVRRAVSTNCEWYRRLCAAHVRYRKRLRKPRTYIKRCDTIKALRRLRAGRTDSVYVARILEVVELMGLTPAPGLDGGERYLEMQVPAPGLDGGDNDLDAEPAPGRCSGEVFLDRDARTGA